ncbi:MAG: hypothetical protein NC548_66230 [Lachnospiraceae bacterium]|nr:hypothetical protein [Lachnospiraceae bacterium]
MEEEKLIMEEAPPDDSTFFQGEPARKESDDAQGIEPFPIAQMIQEASINERE